MGASHLDTQDGILYAPIKESYLRRILLLQSVSWQLSTSEDLVCLVLGRV